MSAHRSRRRTLRHGLVAVVLASAVWSPAAGAESGGYHHLGAVSGERWTGVTGRLQVRDPGVRKGTYDFVAARFMAKQPLADGGTAWLEAGWSENGWRSGGGQVVYTYDSVSGQWAFHEKYPLRDGDRIWISLKSSPDGEWAAWLWWGGQWRLLTTAVLPGGGDALVEEFVEVYVDPERAGVVPVPAIEVDNVSLRDPAGRSAPWRAELATAVGGDKGRYCVHWQRPYHTWSAGDCRTD